MWSAQNALLTILSGALNIRIMRQKHALDPLIDTKRTALARAERSVEKLRIELTTLEKARAATADTGPTKQSLPRYRPTRNATNGVTTGKRRGRSLSTPWKNVLARIGSKGNWGASVDDIAAFCAAEGVELKRATLRAQM